jgi:hypothetical protein
MESKSQSSGRDDWRERLRRLRRRRRIILILTWYW